LDFTLFDVFPPESSQIPLSTILSLASTLAVIVYAVIQSSKSSDDDGPGDGGLMQPVGAGA
jgi:hypothetical protein